MDRIKGFEVMWTSKNQNVAVTYNRFGMGSRYNIYRKATSALWCGELACHWKYVRSSESIGEAIGYAQKILDEPEEHVERMVANFG